jgi:hypothetical protein
VKGVSSEKLTQIAPRPKNVWLSGHKLTTAIGPHAVRRVGQGLRDMRNTVFASRTVESF